MDICFQSQTPLSSFNIQKPSTKNKELFSKKWTVAENILYARYLKTHLGQMNSQKKRKSGKFIKMSNYIGSKSENQCRSHHQKMLLTYDSIQNIIKYVSEVKKLGKLINVDDFKRAQPIQESETTQMKEIRENKIEEQTGTQRESEQQIKQSKKNSIQQKQLDVKSFPLIEEQSKFVERSSQDSIFQVLNVELWTNEDCFFTF